MKTLKNFKRLIHALTVLGLVSTVSIGCGNDNRSGGNSNSSPQPIPPTGAINNGGVFNTANQDINLLRQQPCSGGRQRIPVSIPIQGAALNNGGSYIGSTLEGDIAIATNSAQGPILQMEVCQRNGLVNTPQIVSFEAYKSRYCSSGELVTTVYFPIQTGNYYTLNFHPQFYLQMCSRSNW